MKEVNASTKRGQQLVAMGSRYEGFTLTQVYDRPSAEKERAWQWCYDQYRETEDSTAFGICSHNTFQYTVSWLGTKDGENIMRIETAKSSYLVWLDR